MHSFGGSCEDHTDRAFGKFYESELNDTKPFGCAWLSFCPDVCYGRAIMANKDTIADMNRQAVQQSNLSLCHDIDDGSCQIESWLNKDIEMMKANRINVSCRCDYGYRFNTQLKTCVDTDECVANLHDCHRRHETCLNTKGSYMCVCKHGYKIENLTVFGADKALTNERRCTSDLDLLVLKSDLFDIESDFNGSRCSHSGFFLTLYQLSFLCVISKVAS